MTLNSELRCSAVENGEIYGISYINFTIASFAAMVVQSTGCDEQNESMGIIKNERDKFHYREFCSKWSREALPPLSRQADSSPRAEEQFCAERVAKSKTSQWGLSKTREINFTIDNTSSDRSREAIPPPRLCLSSP